MLGDAGSCPCASTLPTASVEAWNHCKIAIPDIATPMSTSVAAPASRIDKGFSFKLGVWITADDHMESKE